MGQTFKIIEIVFILQGFKGLIHHLSLFLDITITVFVIFKTDNNDWFVVLSLDFALKCDTTIVPNLDLEEAMLNPMTVLIKLTYQAIKAIFCSGTPWNHDNRRQF